MDWCVYILKCRDKSYYVGVTNDMIERFLTHSSGKGSKYVRSKLPIEVAWVASIGTRSLAQRVEYFLKKLNHRGKDLVVKGEIDAKEIISCCSTR